MALKNLKVNLTSILKTAGFGRSTRDAFFQVLNNRQAKQELGEKTIDAIIARTEKGLNKKGQRFTGYSESYIKSAVFKIEGKSRGKVNLRLTGAMHADIDVVEITPRGFEIGFTEPQEEAKAEGHVRGANFLPVRDFWGLPSKEKLKDIINETVSNQVSGAIELIDLLEVPLEITTGAGQETLVFA